ncbi:MAG: hypothetical protein J6T10_09300 [Methanobrevibacter sp.]|nr:hypothetical protein [Methanobrevibacter sp.]
MSDLVERKAVLKITEETGAFETQHRVRKLPSVNPSMTENHKNFLNELAALFNKYSIDTVSITNFNKLGKFIVFESNGEELYFKSWDNEMFTNVVVRSGENDYKPYEQESKIKTEKPIGLD